METHTYTGQTGYIPLSGHHHQKMCALTLIEAEKLKLLGLALAALLLYIQTKTGHFIIHGHMILEQIKN